jgi:hypothetical protein
MKYLIILSVFVLFISCKELGEAIYESPVIESFELTPDGPVFPLDTVTAVVIASNPEKGTLIYEWDVDPEDYEAQLIPPLNANTVRWIAPFEGGEYTITAIVRNDKKKTRSADIIVQSLEKPYVRINEPSNSDYFVQGQQIEIVADAFHPNNLTQVWLEVAGVSIEIKDYNSSDRYTFSYTPDSTVLGPVELKVTAEANTIPTGNTSSDYVIVNVEGILPKAGKH